MDYLGIIIVVAVALVEIQGKSLDPGPQELNDSAKLPPLSNQKRYATKEIILYLTPSQIKALQEGQGWISAQNSGPREGKKQVQAYAQNPPANQDQSQHLNRHLANPQLQKVAPVEEPQSDNFNPIIPPPEYRPLDNYAYLNFQPQPQPQNKPVLFSSESQEQTTFNNRELPNLNAQEPRQEKGRENQYLRDHLKQQWYRLLDQNRAQLKGLAALSKYQNEKSNENKKEVTQSAPNFSEQKYASGVEHSISNNNQLQWDNQQALLHAEAIANLPPVLVHKEISIKHSPVHLIKQVKVPVPTPVLIPVPEPFEVKVPHPYPVPIEVIKQVPVPSAPIEVEKHIPIPVTKNVYINVDRPYFVEPREIPERKTLVPIQNQGWQ